MGRSIARPPEVRRLEALYRRHHRRVRWVLRSRGIHDQELDDVVHDVFLAIHRRFDDRDPTVPEDLWVTGVARNVAFAYRRGHARRLRMLDDVPEPAPSRSLDDELARREAWQQLRSFLETLNEEQREAFVLMDLLGLATAEIADVTGAPANTVSSRVRLARRRFDERFADLRGREAAFLRAAGIGERPSRRQRQQTLAGIVAAIPASATPWIAAPTAAASVAKWAIGTAVVTTLAIGASVKLGRRAPSQPAAREVAAGSKSPRAKASRHAKGPDASSAAGVDTDADASSPSGSMDSAGAPSGSADRPPRSHVAGSPTADAAPSNASAAVGSSSPAPADAAPADPAAPGADATADLAEAVTLLREAENRLAAGDPAGALARIDAYRERFEPGPLHRDRLRIERRAACAEGKTQRAAEARRQLVKLRLAAADEPDCP